MWQRVPVTSAPSPRRIGSSESKTRTQLLDAAERLLLTEGYAAVTSRRLAAAAGLKPQLVHYYFRTMDDLFIEVFRRRAEGNIERVERTMAERPSLRRIWDLNADSRGARFNLEYVALAHHRPAIRAEVARFAERFREAQRDALDAALRAAGVEAAQLPSVVALLLMTGVAQVLGLEEVLGVTTGHAETRAFIESAIELMEQPRPVAPKRRRRRG